MIKAIKDTIIVKQEYAKQSEGIFIPDTAVKFKKYDGLIQYVVVSVGPDYLYGVKVGDRVCIRRHEGKKLVYEGVEYFVMQERWVEGVYE